MADVVMTYLAQQGGDLITANRASIMGVSTPTYLKRAKGLLQEQQHSKPGE